jgi:hypothetical protein
LYFLEFRTLFFIKLNLAKQLQNVKYQSSNAKLFVF